MYEIEIEIVQRYGLLDGEILASKVTLNSLLEYNWNCNGIFAIFFHEHSNNIFSVYILPIVRRISVNCIWRNYAINVVLQNYLNLQSCHICKRSWRCAFWKRLILSSGICLTFPRRDPLDKVHSWETEANARCKTALNNVLLPVLQIWKHRESSKHERLVMRSRWSAVQHTLCT